MKAKASFFLFLFALFVSCNSSEKCDCDKICPDQEPILLTSENSMSSEDLYNAYLSNVLAKATSQIEDQNFGQLSEDERQKLKEEFEHSKENFNPKIAGGICPPCPKGICCSNFDYFRFDNKFNKVKLITKAPHKTYIVGNQTIIPIKDIKGNSLLDSLTFRVKDYKGEDVNFNLIIN